jgi:hypothetical protein
VNSICLFNERLKNEYRGWSKDSKQTTIDKSLKTCIVKLVQWAQQRIIFNGGIFLDLFCDTSFGTLYSKHNDITLGKLTPWHKISKKLNATFAEVSTWVKAHYAPPPNYSHKHKKIAFGYFLCMWTLHLGLFLFISSIFISFRLKLIHLKRNSNKHLWTWTYEIYLCWNKYVTKHEKLQIHFKPKVMDRGVL